MLFTPEQQRILASTGNIKINAVAGSGKTTTVIAYAKSRPAGSRILYLAFNKTVKLEAAQRLQTAGLVNVQVDTAHSLAFRNIVPQYAYQLKPNGYKTHEIAGMLGFVGSGEKHAAFIVANHINRFISFFCNSVEPRVKDIDYRTVVKEVIASEFVDKYYEFIELQTRTILANMDKGAIPITHDFYLKKFQLSHPILPYDYILFDEAQDASPAMLDVFLRQPATKVIVGDTHQQIYGWRFAVNSLEKTHFDSLNLSTSFRFGTAIAHLAKSVLEWKNEVEATPITVTLNGKGSDKMGKTKATIARSNLRLLLKAIEFVKNNPHTKHIYFEGNIHSYTYAEEGASLYDVLNLKKGKKLAIKDPLVAQMGTMEELEEYIESTGDVELGMMVELVNEYGDDIYDLIKTIKDKHVSDTEKHKAEMVFSTVHRCKGMEYDTVFLANDFITYEKVMEFAEEMDNTDARYTPAQINEEINLLYVAITRTKQELFIPESLLPENFPVFRNIHVVKSAEARQDSQGKAVPVTKAKFGAKKEPPKPWASKNKPYLQNRMEQKSKNTTLLWTEEMDIELSDFYGDGQSITQIAKHFGCSEASVKSRLRKINVV